MTDRLGIEFISGLCMPPIEFVHLAADLDVHQVGMALAPFNANPYGYATWSLREDAKLKRDLIAALAERQVSISVSEGFLIRPGSDIQDAAADLALFAELGATRANILSIDNDVSHSIDELGAFADMAAAVGFSITLEFMAGMAIGSLSSAADVVSAVGRGNVSVMLDCMHFARSGGLPAELAAADQTSIGYLQLCDVPDRPLDASYGIEARDNRLAPGEGDVPLAEILAAAPSDIPIGLEVPMAAKAEAGVSARDALSDAIAKARALLKRLEN